MFASHLLRIGYQWVDALWVRGLGVDATAAVTSSMFLMWWVLALNDVFAIGAVSYVSQLMGAGDRRRAGRVAYIALRGSALMGLLGTVAALTASRPLFALMSHDPGIVDSGSSYLRIVLACVPLPMVSLTCESILRACGNTRTTLWLDLAAVTFNAALDPFLIYGWGPFPRLGVAGAAWATVLAQALLVIAYLTLALRGHRAFPLARTAPGPPVKLAGMARVGAPAALIGSLFSVVYVAFARAASEFGPASMAVVGIVNRIEALQFMTSVALGVAGATLVGQNLGAGRPERAEQVVRTGLRWGASIATGFMLLFLLLPEPFLRLFSSDPEVLRLGVPYMRVLALCLIPNAMEIVTAESLMGSGHTRVMSAIFTTFSLARIPLAFWASRALGGVIGVAWVISVTCILRGLWIVAWAARGTWKSGLTRELHGESGVPPGAGPA